MEQKNESWIREFDEKYPPEYFSTLPAGFFSDRNGYGPARELKDFIRSLLQDREEWLRGEIKAMKPILYHKDPNRHLENVARYNTLDEVLLLLTPKN